MIVSLDSLVFGYVGPAGVGTVGVLLVVVLVLLVGAVGLVLHPLKLYLRHRRRVLQEQPVASHTHASAQPLDEGN